MDAATSTVAPVHPLIANLVSRHGFVELTAATFEAWAAAPGHALVAFVDDPAKLKESLDLAVIAPELARAAPGALRCAVLMPEAARAVAVRFGFRRWPALVLLRDGGYVGAIDGLRAWEDYVNELARLLAAPAARPPSIGVAVAAPRDAGACRCRRRDR